MAYLQFQNDDTLHQCDVIPEGNIVTLKFLNNVIQSTKGFDLYNDEEKECNIGGTYYRLFRTVYRNDKDTALYNGYQLSNDGSIYVEPEPPTPPEPPSIEDIRAQKIGELSSICEKIIFDGVAVNDNKFSYKSEDRGSIKTAVEMAVATGLDVMWHPNNNGCRLFTKEEIVEIYITQETNLTHNTTYFNQLKMSLLSNEDREHITSTKYGDPLTGEYLKTYNKMMLQAQAIVSAYLKQIGAV